MRTLERGPHQGLFDLWSRFYDAPVVQRLTYRPGPDACASDGGRLPRAGATLRTSPSRPVRVPHEFRGLGPAQISANFRKLDGIVRHTFTHFELEIEVYRVDGIDAAPVEGVWAALTELDTFALPSLMRKVLRHAVGEGPSQPPFVKKKSERKK